MKSNKKWTKIASATLAAALAVSMSPAVPALAAEGDAGASTPATQPQTIANGLYKTTDYSYSTGMVDVDPADAPAYVNVTDEGITLNVRVYTPSKYDYAYKGGPSDRPDPKDTDKLIKGVPIVADSAYLANGTCKDHAFVDKNGVLGAKGQTYKAMYFEIPLTRAELDAGSVDVSFRYSTWYKSDRTGTSRQQTWMGTETHSFTFKNLTPVNTGISGWGNTTTGRSGKVNGHSTYDLDEVSAVVDETNDIPANPTSADAKQYSQAMLDYDQLDYTTSTSTTYLTDKAGLAYLNIAFPEVKQKLEAAGKAIPNVVPKDGTYEFLMNQKGGNGWACDSISTSDRLYNAKLVVKDGKMTLQAAQRRGSYSLMATMTPSQVEAATKAKGLEKPDTSIPGVYDYQQLKSVYVEHPDSGEPGMHDMCTATFPIESLEKPITVSCYGSAWFNRSYVLSESNMVTEATAKVAREVNALMNDPDPEDISNLDPFYRIDPTKVTSEQADAINQAEKDYKALSSDEKASFDKLAVVDGEGITDQGKARLEPYGRVLENAVWGLRAAQATDNATKVAAGSYKSSKLASTSSSGKATGPEKTTWSVSDVTVKGGKATATIVSKGSDYTSVKTNGQTYANAAAPGKKSTFQIPVDLGGTTYFVVTGAKGSAAYTVDVSMQSFAVNAKTVNAKAVKNAAKKADATAKGATSITVGTKAKKISASAFKGFAKVKTLDVRSTKLTKKGVKGSLKGSAVKTVKVPKAKNAAYKKIFTKANAGKKVTVK